MFCIGPAHAVAVCVEEHDDIDRYFSPSTNDSDAMEVVKMMVSKGWQWDAIGFPKAGGVQRVHSPGRDSVSYWCSFARKPDIVESECTTMAEAICLSSLATMGVTDDE